MLALYVVPSFESNVLTWPTRRDRNPFRVFLVEPRAYDPPQHQSIFDATVTHLLGNRSATKLTGSASGSASASVAQRFDLVTFPEAFLTCDGLVGSLSALAEAAPLDLMGCIHVGLRADTDPHFLRRRELDALIQQLAGVPRLEQSDIRAFAAWLGRQPEEDQFNVACLFTIDADGLARVCLHPKLRRSVHELSLASEDHMAEATLVSIVRLRPRDRTYPSTTVQPVICSDVFLDGADLPGGGAIAAVAAHPDCFDDPPDQIDIVSVATCTPTRARGISASGTPRFSWRSEFLNAFVALAKGHSHHRHRAAAIALANYLDAPTHGQGPRPGGLSGIFLPTPAPREDRIPATDLGLFATMDVFCRPKDDALDEEGWHTFDEYLARSKPEQTLGHLVNLRRDSPRDGAASLVHFEIARLPREATRWNRDGRVVNMRVFDIKPGAATALEVVPRSGVSHGS